MALWSVVKKQDRYDLYYVGSEVPEGVKRCTVDPQPLDCVLFWVLEPEQAGFWDVIQLDGVDFALMETGLA